MKRITNYLLSTLMLAVVFTSCKKEENQIFYEGGTAPTLTANKTASIAVAFANADMEAVKFSWTNPNYKFSTGLSSQDVFYKLEIDTTNAAGTANPNFTFSGKQTIGVSKDLSVSITQGQLNDYLLNQLQLVPGMVHYLQIRLIANLVNSNATLMSNVIKLSTTPYAIPPKVDPPASGTLFIVGNATPGGDATGWNNPVPVPSQQFTRLNSVEFTLTLNGVNGGKEYLMLPVNGDWSNKYSVANKTIAGLNAGGDFGYNLPDNFPGPTLSGNYKFDVNFATAKFKVTKL